jgi:hypothetical protein
MTKKSLDKKELAFLEAYMGNGYNKTEAYLVAVGPKPNTKPATITRMAQKWVNRRPLLLAAIEKGHDKALTAVEEIHDRYAISQARIEQEYAAIAFSNVGDIMSWGEDGKVIFKSSSELTPEAMKFVAGVEYTPGVTRFDEDTGEEFMMRPPVVKIKTQDKLKALEALAKSRGMFKDSEPNAPVININILNKNG